MVAIAAPAQATAGTPAPRPPVRAPSLPGSAAVAALVSAGGASTTAPSVEITSSPAAVASPATWIGERDALLSSLDRVSATEAPAVSWMPGRLAQSAELLATVAERRVARQLGLPPVTYVPSVQRSADAFAPASWVHAASVGQVQTDVVARGGSRVFDAAGFAWPALAPAAAPASAATGRGPAARHAASMSYVAADAPSLTSTLAASAVMGAANLASALPTFAATAPAPMSIASLMAFADAQLGPRLLREAQPLPVQLPSLKFVQGEYVQGEYVREADGAPRRAGVARTALASGRPQNGPDAQSGVLPAASWAQSERAVPAPSMPYLSAVGAEWSRSSSSVMALGGHMQTPVQQTFGLGQQARRSERWAGEVGARAASLASDFLPNFAVADATDRPLGIPVGSPGMPVLSTPPTDLVSATRGGGHSESVVAKAELQRAGISSSEWMLLSLFPSAATAQEVARSVSSRNAPDLTYASLVESPLASPRSIVANAASTATSTAPRGIGLSSGPSLRTWVERGALGVDRFEDGASGSSSSSSLSSTSLSSTSLSSSSAGTGTAMVASAAPGMSYVSASPSPARAQGRSPMTVSLPDGRRPRGNRLAAGPSMPMLHAVAAATAAAARASNNDAAHQRVESPDHGPLWGHLPGPKPAMTTVLSAEGPRAHHSATHAAALELVTPYVEAARPPERSMAASFTQQPVAPAVAATPSNSATQSMVSALSSSAGQSGGDRLSLADLTLISIMSAGDQVAAADHQASAPPAAAATTGSGNGIGNTGGAAKPDEDAEVELIADRAFGRLMVEIRQYLDNKGEPWER